MAALIKVEVLPYLPDANSYATKPFLALINELNTLPEDYRLIPEQQSLGTYPWSSLSTGPPPICPGSMPCTGGPWGGIPGCPGGWPKGEPGGMPKPGPPTKGCPGEGKCPGPPCGGPGAIMNIKSCKVSPGLGGPGNPAELTGGGPPPNWPGPEPGPGVEEPEGAGEGVYCGGQVGVPAPGGGPPE
ncbi:UNVERIFIED_CONTAM: hypothetical protein B566_EDAN017650 [Ephemera danica]|nr:hypothetical protein B566_EDAN017650 [Ephemera danica]